MMGLLPVAVDGGGTWHGPGFIHQVWLIIRVSDYQVYNEITEAVNFDVCCEIFTRATFCVEHSNSVNF